MITKHLLQHPLILNQHSRSPIYTVRDKRYISILLGIPSIHEINATVTLPSIIGNIDINKSIEQGDSQDLRDGRKRKVILKSLSR